MIHMGVGSEVLKGEGNGLGKL
jgi:hypothetical protein